MFFHLPVTARFIAIMNITPAIIMPGASGESSQPNLAPLPASKAAGVLRGNNYQSVFHHLVPEIVLRGLTQVEAHVRMIKMRARLGEYNCRVLNLRKLSPDDPTLPRTRTSLLKEEHNIVQFIQVLELPLVFSCFLLLMPIYLQNPPQTSR